MLRSNDPERLAAPGLAFCPSVYFDFTGPVYLSKAATSVRARWVKTDDLLADWLKGQSGS